MPEEKKNSPEVVNATKNGHGGFRIDTSGWTNVKPAREWSRVARVGNMDGMVEFMLGIIVAWPYAGDPAEDESYDELTAEQWQQVVEEVNNAVGAFFPDRKR
jgi:hypothetical protein